MHRLFSAVLAASLALPAVASIPPASLGLPTSSNNLNLRFPSQKTGTTAGQHYAPKVPAHAPKISVDLSDDEYGFDPSGKYLVVMVDPDTRSTSGQYLHWLEKDLQLSGKHGRHSGDDGSSVESAHSKLAKSTVVPYRGPQATAGDDAHLYIVYLFKQPRHFSVPKHHQDRATFDVAQFAEDADLGDPVAANWFTCSEGEGPDAADADRAEQHLLEKRAGVAKIGKKVIGKGAKKGSKNKNKTQTVTPTSSSMTMTSTSSSMSSSTGGAAAAMITAAPAKGIAAAALGAAGVALAL